MKDEKEMNDEKEMKRFELFDKKVLKRIHDIAEGNLEFCGNIEDIHSDFRDIVDMIEDVKNYPEENEE